MYWDLRGFISLFESLQTMFFVFGQYNGVTRFDLNCSITTHTRQREINKEYVPYTALKIVQHNDMFVACRRQLVQFVEHQLCAHKAFSQHRHRSEYLFRQVRYKRFIYKRYSFVSD